MSLRATCEHLFGDGHRCGSPALSGDTHCYYHHRYKRTAAFGDPAYSLPPTDERHGLKTFIADILRDTTTGRIEPRLARTLLWGARMAQGVIREIEKQERQENAKP
jgi:hypothetical protein